jgi:predicted nucleotidyltransferase
VQRQDLYMRHRKGGAKVDVVPCGPVEDPPGNIQIPGSTRHLNTAGLTQAFGSARVLDLGGPSLLVPTPAAFVLVKSLAFLDRRARHDLSDLGSVLCRFPVDEEAIWSSEAVMEGFRTQTLQWEDLPAWFLGRSLAETFSAEVVAAFRHALDQLAAETSSLRALLIDSPASFEERVARADRQFEVLRRALDAA